jgi:S1-C subfamily serine protease
MENINTENNQENKTVKEKKPKSLTCVIITMIILSVLLSSFFGTVFGFLGGKISDKIFSKISQKFGKGASVSTEISRERIVEEDSAIIDVVEKSSPAVVSIVITKDVPTYKSFFEDPFGFLNNSQGTQKGTEKKTIGGGSGFIVSSNGMIVTNKHVASDQSADYTVITNDGKEYPAKILAVDPNKDIAVIKIEGEDFPTLEFGNSESLKVGQTVIAIGNSLGEFSNSVSKGIISGLRRDITAGSGFGKTEQLTGIIQTDAAINSGNSGGPLLDISGKVIGVNVAMAQGAENVAFSIPVDQIKKIVEQVKSTGKISTPFLGVRSILINQEIQKDNNLPFAYGAIVARGTKVSDFAVIPGSPADKAGILENDIILEINGTKIDNKNQTTNLVSSYNAGDTITLKIWRKGEIKDIKVTLEERK